MDRHPQVTARLCGLLKVIALGCVFALSFGCATADSPRTPAASNLVIWGNTMSEDEMDRLEDGRRLYINECTRCHDMRWPDERSPENWKMVLRRHRGLVPVDDAKFKDLADYVLRVSYCFESRKCASMAVKSH